jgi:hypothetical protein
VALSTTARLCARHSRDSSRVVVARLETRVVEIDPRELVNVNTAHHLEAVREGS